jgi:hypothetical protein
VTSATNRVIDLSQVLSNFVPMVMSPPKQLGRHEGPIVSSWVDLAIESFRLNLPHSVTPSTYPVVHLAYWHCRLLAYLFMPSSITTDVFWAAKELVKELTRNRRLHSPLNHHFSALVAATVIELSQVAQTHDEAMKLLRELHDTPTAPSAWDSAIMAAVAEKLARPDAATGTNSHNLQHLADLATATTELATGAAASNAVAAGEDAPAPAADESVADETPIKYRTMSNYEDLGFDPRPMLRIGYLNYFPATGDVGLSAE